jgi:hypothetical protein
MEQATCTKPAGFPLDPLNLGGCILDFGHDGPCGFRFGNGVMQITRHDGPELEGDRYLRLCRRNYRVSLGATAVSVLSAATLLWQALSRLNG